LMRRTALLRRPRRPGNSHHFPDTLTAFLDTRSSFTGTPSAFLGTPSAFLNTLRAIEAEEELDAAHGAAEEAEEAR